jgi:hypothetical protein
MSKYFVILGLGSALVLNAHNANTASLQPHSLDMKAPARAEANPASWQMAAQSDSSTVKKPSQQMQQQSTTVVPQKATEPDRVDKSIKMSPSTNPPNQVEEAKLVSVNAGTPLWISWGYLRVYQPETLGRILGDVNTGRLPRAAIAGVVPPAQIDTLLKNTAQSASANKLPSTAGQQDSQVKSGAVRQEMTSIKTSTGVVPKPVFSVLPLLTSPNRIEFGAIMSGQMQLKTIRFMSPLNGEVRVSISDPAFRIRQLRSLNGTFAMRTVPATLEGGATIQTTHAVPNVTQQRTAPPWAIPVRSGEDVEIAIDVSPSSSVTLGEHQAPLKIELTNSPGATVPVHARLDGRLYGIGIDVAGQFSVLPAKDFILPFEWVNGGEPGEATLTLENPPAGFSTATPVQTVKLGKGEHRQGAFLINVSNALVASEPRQTTLQLKLVNGANRLSYSLDVTIWPIWLVRSVVGRARFNDGESVDVSGLIQIRNDGWFQFEGNIGYGKSAFIYRYDVGVSVPGAFAHTVHGSFGRGRCVGCSPNLQDTWAESGNNAILANNFIAAASGLGRAGFNPYIKVTRSVF